MFSLYDECVMMPLNAEVRSNCMPFSCGNDDLDEFFLQDADLYAEGIAWQNLLLGDARAAIQNNMRFHACQRQHQDTRLTAIG